MSIKQAPHEPITGATWWSSRPAHRKEADVKICRSMDIQNTEETKENVASSKPGDGESFHGIPYNVPPELPAGMEALR